MIVLNILGFNMLTAGFSVHFLQLTTEAMLDHMNKLLQIPGSKLLFGGKPLENHSIPSIYGALKPTAIYVPLEEISRAKNYELVTTEIFGPFQVKGEFFFIFHAFELYCTSH